MSDKDGGPALPIVFDSIDARGVPFHNVIQGMSLRDYFAAAALNGLLISNIKNWNPESCFEIADAMLEARQRSEPKESE